MNYGTIYTMSDYQKVRPATKDELRQSVGNPLAGPQRCVEIVIDGKKCLVLDEEPKAYIEVIRELTGNQNFCKKD